MKYRTKLFLTFTIIVFISTSIALFIVYSESSKLLISQLRGQILSIAVTSAASINGNKLEKINQSNYATSPYYQELIDQLRLLRDANRRPDIYVQYLYIIKPKKGASHYIFVADGEENPEKVSHYNDLFPTSEQFYQQAHEPFVLQGTPYDLWGTWLSAYAPIYNEDGLVVGTLGVDISMKAIKQKMIKLISFGVIALIGSLIISVIIAHLLAKLVTNSLSYLCETVEEIGGGNFRIRAHLDTNDEFDELSLAINAMAKGLEEREKLKLGFSRYVSQYVLEKILHSDTPTKLEGERRKVTIFFSDIRQFTKISEQLPPEKVVSLLNQYFEKMIEIIFAHQGTLDKFIGDGIMAEFGAPLEDNEQEKHAVLAAIKMQKELLLLSKKWDEEGYPKIVVGMGIHTGFAILGNIGSNIRMEYTAIGDTVNVASRLESATKKQHENIIISEETYQAIKDHKEFQFKDLGEVELPGRKKVIRAYALVYDLNQQP